MKEKLPFIQATWSFIKVSISFMKYVSASNEHIPS